MGWHDLAATLISSRVFEAVGEPRHGGTNTDGMATRLCGGVLHHGEKLESWGGFSPSRNDSDLMLSLAEHEWRLT